MFGREHPYSALKRLILNMVNLEMQRKEAETTEGIDEGFF